MSDAHLDRARAHARARWPEVDLDAARYRAFATERGFGGEPLDEATGDELYLACACAGGSPQAIRAFEEVFFDEIDILIRKERKPELRDELAQQVRVKLFLPRQGGERAIASYRGQGSLRRWFRLICARTLINMTTRRGPELPADEDFLVDLIGGDVDPELELIKKSYRRTFGRAFRAAFASLDPRERELLRGAFRDGLTVDALGTIHGVHRATAARWVVRAHRELLAAIRARLRDDLRMSRSEIESMFALIFSRMDITLGDRVDVEASSDEPSD